MPCEEHTVPWPSTEALTCTGPYFVEIVGPTIAAPQTAGDGGTVVCTGGGAVTVALDGGAVAPVLVGGAAAPALVGGAVTTATSAVFIGEASVFSGGALPRSIPVLGRSKAANKNPLAPINVKVGKTRRENVSLLMVTTTHVQNEYGSLELRRP